MKSKPETKILRPLPVDLGRGEETHRIQFVRRTPAGRRVFELPADGGVVTWRGREKHFWLRRIREGAVEIVEPPKPTRKSKPKKAEE